MTGRVRLTARGVSALVLGALLAGLGGWWRYPGVAAFGAALVLLVVAAVVSVVVPAPVRAERTVRPRTVHRLGTCTGTLSLTSTSRRLPVRLDAVDLIGGTPIGIEVPALAPGEESSVDYPVPTTRRGVLAIGPLELRRPGLAGLAGARMSLGEVTDVRVVPRVLPVRGLPAGVRRGHVGADERVERGGTDLVGLREYVAGDDLRRLHWATSARTGVLMVREDADPARPHLAVLLDDRAAVHPDADGFEDAVETAASLLTAAVAGGHPVRLMSASGGVELEVPAGALSDDTALAALADIQPVSGVDGLLPVPVRDLDVVAVISGVGADQASLLLEAGRASVGVVLVVDPAAAAPSAHAVGGALVLTGSRVEDLVALWDTVVAR
ncbi:DUF58 domain-containing protein [Actinophytocola oryzae]|uniref:Uncharacterized protein (DUF58 family) n=1 Tax=Actinophytocola oryzae TaxID=502181 RepID=A0A4R7W597_9PSEU|nr:DUF58 domain-containing protein [Actinophytocola oryzae]TDV57159.1 uncharacterized protein (DUF58 family) [Actinophytocola oryzae]